MSGLLEAKGQSSFELLAMLGFLIVLSSFLILPYLGTLNSVVGVTVLKTLVLEEVSHEDLVYFIEGIEYSSVSGTNTFTVNTEPSLSPAVQSRIQAQAIPKISSLTPFQESSIVIAFE